MFIFTTWFGFLISLYFVYLFIYLFSKRIWPDDERTGWSRWISRSKYASVYDVEAIRRCPVQRFVFSNNARWDHDIVKPNSFAWFHKNLENFEFKLGLVLRKCKSEKRIASFPRWKVDKSNKIGKPLTACRWGYRCYLFLISVISFPSLYTREI